MSARIESGPLMSREPDWESLGSIQFLLHQRIAECLNTALAAIHLIDAPEADNAPPGFWQQRASDAALRALEIENAWSSLIRHRLGEHFLPQHLLHFHTSELIRWLATEIGCPQYATPGEDMLLHGNRETLQEALLLLHSCAGTLGPHVRLVVQPTAKGMWFRIRYGRVKNPPLTLDQLIEALATGGNWRSETALFELQRADDFLTMNGCTLYYRLEPDYGELAFLIPAAYPADKSTSATAVLSDEDDTARGARSDQLETPVIVSPPEIRRAGPVQVGH
jgi:hypothetical protein